MDYGTETVVTFLEAQNHQRLLPEIEGLMLAQDILFFTSSQ